MCGLFAAVGTPIDVAHLRMAARGAGRRGPHGHGWTARTGDGRLVDHRALGPLDPTLPGFPPTCSAVVGHTRLATSGRHDDVQGLQPFHTPGPVGVDHVAAHNGVVYNAGSLAADAVTDSHALVLAYAAARTAGMDPLTAIARTVERAVQQAWVLVVLDGGDGRLYGHRHQHPLYACTRLHGVYWSSQKCCPHAVMTPDQTPFTAETEATNVG